MHGGLVGCAGLSRLVAPAGSHALVLSWSFPACSALLCATLFSSLLSQTSARVPRRADFSVIVDTKVINKGAQRDPSSLLTDPNGGASSAGPAGAAAAGGDDETKMTKLGKELRMDLGDVYYGLSYVNRSFVVQNLSSMPLDFVISHNLQSGPSATEVNFSLSNTSLKVFSTLLVPPNSSTRVFVHFRTSAQRESSSTSRLGQLAADH